MERAFDYAEAAVLTTTTSGNNDVSVLNPDLETSIIMSVMSILPRARSQSSDGLSLCIQTLVEYGSNVTVQNQQGERPSQSAERQGHTTCARYLVVVETCMSLASQVVKLTKQLNE